MSFSTSEPERTTLFDDVVLQLNGRDEWHKIVTIEYEKQPIVILYTDDQDREYTEVGMEVSQKSHLSFLVFLCFLIV